MSETGDVTLIRDEDLLRKMWQQTEDFSKKREIRAHMYKLREERLRDLYSATDQTHNSITKGEEFSSSHEHSKLFADQSFHSIKSKEVRDASSPPREYEMKLQELKNKADSGWTVDSRSEIADDGHTHINKTNAAISGNFDDETGVGKFSANEHQEYFTTNYSDDKSKYHENVRSEAASAHEEIVQNTESGTTKQKSTKSEQKYQKISSNITTDEVDQSDSTKYFSLKNEASDMFDKQSEKLRRNEKLSSSINREVFHHNIENIDDQQGVLTSRKIEHPDKNTKIVIETRTLPDGSVITTTKTESTHESAKTFHESRYTSDSRSSSENLINDSSEQFSINRENINNVASLNSDISFIDENKSSNLNNIETLISTTDISNKHNKSSLKDEFFTDTTVSSNLSNAKENRTQTSENIINISVENTAIGEIDSLVNNSSYDREISSHFLSDHHNDTKIKSTLEAENMAKETDNKIHHIKDDIKNKINEKTFSNEINFSNENTINNEKFNDQSIKTKPGGDNYETTYQSDYSPKLTRSTTEQSPSHQAWASSLRHDSPPNISHGRSNMSSITSLRSSASPDKNNRTRAPSPSKPTYGTNKDIKTNKTFNNIKGDTRKSPEKSNHLNTKQINTTNKKESSHYDYDYHKNEYQKIDNHKEPKSSPTKVGDFPHSRTVTPSSPNKYSNPPKRIDTDSRYSPFKSSKHPTVSDFITIEKVNEEKNKISIDALNKTNTDTTRKLSTPSSSPTRHVPSKLSSVTTVKETIASKSNEDISKRPQNLNLKDIPSQTKTSPSPVSETKPRKSSLKKPLQISLNSPSDHSSPTDDIVENNKPANETTDKVKPPFKRSETYEERCMKILGIGKSEDMESTHLKDDVITTKEEKEKPSKSQSTKKIKIEEINIDVTINKNEKVSQPQKIEKKTKALIESDDELEEIHDAFKHDKLVTVTKNDVKTDSTKNNQNFYNKTVFTKTNESSGVASDINSTLKETGKKKILDNKPNKASSPIRETNKYKSKFEGKERIQIPINDEKFIPEKRKSSLEEEMDIIIDDIEHAKSSPENTPDRICPTPVKFEEEEDKPRLPDQVSEPEDDKSRRMHHTILEDETFEEDIIEMSEDEDIGIKKHDIHKVTASDECLLSVNEKVSKFTTVADKIQDNLEKSTQFHSIEKELHSDFSGISDKIEKFSNNITTNKDAIAKDHDSQTNKRKPSIEKKSEVLDSKTEEITKDTNESSFAKETESWHAKIKENVTPHSKHVDKPASPKLPFLYNSDSVKKAKELFEHIAVSEEDNKINKNIKLTDIGINHKTTKQETKEFQSSHLKNQPITPSRPKNNAHLNESSKADKFDSNTKFINNERELNTRRGSGKFGVELRKPSLESSSPERRKSSVTESKIEQNIDITDDVTLLEQWLESGVSYELRRRIRARIRYLNKTKLEVNDKHSIAYAKTTEKITEKNSKNISERSIDRLAKVDETKKKHHTDETNTWENTLRSESPRRGKSPDKFVPKDDLKNTQKVTHNSKIETMHVETKSDKISNKEIKPNKKQLPDKKRPPSPTKSVPNNKPNRFNEYASAYMKKVGLVSNKEDKKSKSETSVKSVNEKIVKTTQSSGKISTTDRITRRSPSPIYKKTKDTVDVSTGGNTTKITVEKLSIQPEDKPSWVMNNGLKKTVVTETKTYTTKRKEPEKPKYRSASPSKAVAKPLDVITSSYGVGPVDTDGKPLFGIKALRNATKYQVKGTVVREEYHSTNGGAPEGEISVTAYSSNPRDLEKILSEQKLGQSDIRKSSFHGLSAITSTKRISGENKTVERKAIEDSKTTKISDAKDSESRMYKRQGSVKSITEKFIKNAVESNKTEKSQYPKAGLILRSVSIKDSEDEALSPKSAEGENYTEITKTHISGPGMEQTSTTQKTSRSKEQTRQTSDTVTHTSQKSSQKIVSSSQTSKESSRTSQENKRVRSDSSQESYRLKNDSSATSPETRRLRSDSGLSSQESTRDSNRSSFLDSKTKVTGVKDILTRMKNADIVIEKTDSTEDAEARSLLNKFLGATVLMAGMKNYVVDSSAERVTNISRTERNAADSDWSESDLQNIWEETTLYKLLESCSDYDRRRQIRARLRQLMAEKEACEAVSAALKDAGGDQTDTSNDGTAVSRDGAATIKTSCSQKVSTEKSVTETKTKTTKVTGNNVTKTAPKPVSPFDKFKQLEKQSSTSNPSSPASPTVSNKPMFKFTDPALAASAATIKDRLLQWCRDKTRDYENVKLENFSTSWSDGLAFCALIHHFLPNAFDYSKLTPEKRRHNFTLAFKVADEKAGIYPLLDVDDMVSMRKPDWKCVFTYVQAIHRRFKDSP